MIFPTIFLIKTLYSALLGFIIGAQRESSGKAAGSRTVALVSLGATVFTILSAEGFAGYGTVLDPARIAAQIVVGIGFLGAGTIIFANDKVQGLTTAASLWVAASVGLLVGVGMYLEALILTGIILLLLSINKVQIKKGWLKK